MCFENIDSISYPLKWKLKLNGWPGPILKLLYLDYEIILFFLLKSFLVILYVEMNFLFSSFSKRWGVISERHNFTCKRPHVIMIFFNYTTKQVEKNTIKKKSTNWI
jgi:hypothetical protein